MSELYHKIPSVFKRDTEGSKQLIYGEFIDDTVKELANVTWDFTEKIDGTNIRVIWDGFNVQFGGRTERAQIPKPLLDKLKHIFKTREAEQVFEQLFGQKNVILFGEGYGGKIQCKGDRNRYKYTEDFILFDVKIGSVFLERINVESIAKAFDIKIVPLVISGTLDEGINYARFPRCTAISCECLTPMEGLVGIPRANILNRKGERVIVKLKTRDLIGEKKNER